MELKTSLHQASAHAPLQDLLNHTDYRRIRSELVSRLARVTDADAVAFCRLAETPHGIYYTQSYAAGRKAHLCRFMLSIGDRPALSGGCTTPHHEVSYRRGRWDLRAPLQTHTNQFTRLGDDIADLAAFRRSEIWDSLYGPMAISDQLRMLIYDSTRSLGWLGVLRADGECYSARSVALLNDLAPHIHQVVWHADILERMQRPSGNRLHHAVFSPDGAPLALSPGFAWQDGSMFRDWLRTLRGSQSRVIDGYAITARPLLGQDGRPRGYAVQSRPLSNVRCALDGPHLTGT